MIEPFLRLALQDCIEIFVVIDADMVSGEQGFPEGILEKHHENGEPILIMLPFDERHVREGTNIEFFENHFEATLGFDKLYRCDVPYRAVIRLLLSNPQYSPGVIANDPPPGLRLVE